jgi:exopolyphosphatase/guanosine-5'-triphosphate,3'-diphosphate pyrophosphatase
MTFTDLDLSKVLTDKHTKLDKSQARSSVERSEPRNAKQPRAPWPVVKDRPTTAVLEIGARSLKLATFDLHGRTDSTIFSIDGRSKRIHLNRRLSIRTAEIRKTLTSQHIRHCDVITTVARQHLPDATNIAKRATGSLKGKIKLIHPLEQAKLVGFAVSSAIPNATGIVADLTYDSLRLCHLRSGHVEAIGSVVIDIDAGLPLETLEAKFFDLTRRTEIRAARGSQTIFVSGEIFLRTADACLRNLRHPVQALHQFEFSTQDLAARISSVAMAYAREVTFGTAALSALARTVRALRIVTSEFGLAEGTWLTRNLRRPRMDPLVAACRRTANHSLKLGPKLLERLRIWIKPAFQDESAAFLRIADAAALLADVGELERAPRQVLEHILAAPFIALTHEERAILGLALYYRCSGKESVRTFAVSQACTPSNHARARRLGEVLRIGAKFAQIAPQSFQRSTLTWNHGGGMTIEGPNIASSTVLELLRTSTRPRPVVISHGR